MKCIKLKKLFPYLCLLTLMAASNAMGGDCLDSYRVKLGDNLTGIIAHKLQVMHKHMNIYGSDGLLAALVSLNSRVLKDPNLIFPGMKISLPGELSNSMKCNGENVKQEFLLQKATGEDMIPIQEPQSTSPVVDSSHGGREPVAYPVPLFSSPSMMPSVLPAVIGTGPPASEVGKIPAAEPSLMPVPESDSPPPAALK